MKDRVSPAMTRAGNYRFGLSRVAFVVALRELADDIEAERVVPQGMEQLIKAPLDDYVTGELRIAYAEKIEEQAS